MADDDKSLTDKVSDKVKGHEVHDDDPRGVGVGPEDSADAAGESPSADEHVVPPGADEDVRLADSWVKADEPPQNKQEQREGDGFR